MIPPTGEGRAALSAFRWPCASGKRLGNGRGRSDSRRRACSFRSWKPGPGRGRSGERAYRTCRTSSVPLRAARCASRADVAFPAREPAAGPDAGRGARTDDEGWASRRVAEAHNWTILDGSGPRAMSGRRFSVRVQRSRLVLWYRSRRVARRRDVSNDGVSLAGTCKGARRSISATVLRKTACFCLSLALARHALQGPDASDQPFTEPGRIP